MGFRALFYVLILAVALLGARGLGMTSFGIGTGADERSVNPGVVLAQDNDDENDSDSDNDGDDDNDGENSDDENSDDDNDGENSDDENSDDENFDDENFDDENFDDDNFDDFDNDGSALTPTSTPIPTFTPVPTPVIVVPAPAAPPPAAAAGPTGSPGNCYFILGFADFHRLLNGRDGECKTNEYADPNGTGDQHQQTTLPVPNGLMVWEKRTNTMRWTDGNKTYTYSKCLWQERLNTQRFRWEQDPTLMERPGETPPPGACDIV